MISIESLYQLFQKYPRVFTDSRKAGQGGLFFALKGDNFDGNDFIETALEHGADYAISDRTNYAGDDKIIIVDDVLVSLQQLANYHRKRLKIPVLAITGTNGKTTTKELITHVLSTKYKVLSTQGNFNNHLGVPLTLLSITAEHELAVIEMGANHPGEIEFLCRIAEPDYGIITNVGRAHLEGFGSFEGVKRTKGELYQYVAKAGKGIFINSGNKNLMAMAPAGIEKYTYAVTGNEAQLTGDVASQDIMLVCKFLFIKGWLYIKTNLSGAYNLENVMAACRVGIQFGIDPLLIRNGIERYVPSTNRSQVIKLGTSLVIADCYNANPSSMEVSIRNFIQIEKHGMTKTMILGDMLELGVESSVEHQKIVDMVSRKAGIEVYWVGESFYNSRLPEGSRKYKNVIEMIENSKKRQFDGRFILLKGSRRIRLEKILDLLK
jgi:UDP-N-acetylmuramoyl-tripeptide--D-alanyl-D-alanine ligase